MIRSFGLPSRSLALRRVTLHRPGHLGRPAAALWRLGVGLLICCLPAEAVVGQLEAWGYNGNGQLGNGTSTYDPTPVPAIVSLPAGITAISIAAGYGQSLASGSNGKLYAWGGNGVGQLGNGSTTDSVTPVVVGLPSGVSAAAIAAGAAHALAVGSDGKVYAWGDNTSGQLGNGTTTGSATPLVVGLPGGVRATAVAAGDYHSLAAGSDGKLYAWGDNSSGQLGTGTPGGSTVPLLVNLPAGVTAIAARGLHSLATGTDGVLYAWGNNTSGELGNGTTTNADTPVAVSLPAGVSATAIAAGDYHSLAAGSDGKLYAWGNNASGQLGIGSKTSTATPTAVDLPSGVAAAYVSAGVYFSMAAGSDGMVYTWGSNSSGQLGTGTTTDSELPVAVSLPAGVKATAVAAGEYHGLAVVSSASNPWTFADAIDAEKAAGGLNRLSQSTLARLDVDGSGQVGLLDAERIARKAAGLDPNP